MTSIGPYSQWLNMSHMWGPPDLRGPLPKKVPCPHSLSGIVQSHPDMTIFAYILRLAKLEDIYNDPTSDFTFLVPSDMYLSHIQPSVFENMDIATAKHIVKSCTLKRKITSSVLEDSPASYIPTLDPANTLFVTNMNGRIYINNDINIIHKDMNSSNGLIHVVDTLIMPNQTQDLSL